MSLKGRALVVDDDAAMLRTISQALALLGYGVRAESGAELVDQLADKAPSI